MRRYYREVRLHSKRTLALLLKFYGLVAILGAMAAIAVGFIFSILFKMYDPTQFTVFHVSLLFAGIIIIAFAFLSVVWTKKISPAIDVDRAVRARELGKRSFYR